MIDWLSRSWRELKKGRPGHRFQERAEKNANSHSSRSWFRRFLQLAIGIIIIAAGIVLCFIPGPGLPLILLGAALLAERSRPIARLMDWLEVKLRSLMGWAKTRWRQIHKQQRFR
jgi:hypothetical protein